VGSQEGQNNERKTTIMRTKLVKSIMVPLLFASALATLVAAERAPRGGTQGGRLEGTWDMQITLTDCSGHTIRSFASQVVFMAGGTLTEESSGTAPALRTGGKGVWRHTADNTYVFRMKSFNFNAQNVLTGWGIISGELTVDSTGDAFAGPGGTVEVYDPNGVLVATFCAESAGTRFEL
jgi:hypothetical protein